jgi:hypothetical protein
MLKLKTLVSVALVAAASTLAIGGNANSQAVIDAGGEGGVSGAAAFITTGTGDVAVGAVAGAVGRTYAISDSYVNLSAETISPSADCNCATFVNPNITAASYGIGTSLYGFEYVADMANIVTFNSLPTGDSTTTVEINVTSNLADDLTGLVSVQNETSLGYPIALVNGEGSFQVNDPSTTVTADNGSTITTTNDIPQANIATFDGAGSVLFNPIQAGHMVDLSGDSVINADNESVISTSDE